MNKTKKNLVPAIRFPEFEAEGPWTEHVLGEIAKFSKGKGISKADLTEGGITPCIRYGELYTDYSEKIDEVKSRTNVNPKKLTLSKANDVIIPASGETQIDIATASCISSAGIAIGGDLNIIRSKLNGVFLSYYLNGAKKREIASLSQGVSVIHLYPSQLQKLVVEIPGINEQNKIGECLASIDDLIKVEAEKLDILDMHKQALLQELYPREGEQLPNSRFQGFIKNGKWNYLNGDKIFKPVSNKKHKGDLPILAITQEHGAIPREQIDYHVSVSKQSILSYKVVEKGDFIISLRSFQGGIEFSNYNGICSPAYIILKNIVEIDKNFFRYYFKSNALIRDLNKNLEGIRDGKMVSFKQFSDVKLPFPSLEEQIKIGEILESHESIINEQKTKLHTLTEHKRGLMQKLFPSKRNQS